MKKKSFRNNLRTMRDELDADYRKKASDAIFSRLKALVVYRRSRTVFLFVSAGSEVETLRWIPEILKDKKVFVPFAEKGRPMRMTEIFSLDELEPNPWGILELPREKVETRSRRSADLILTPGLAFDREGYRMGYGGGFYDRFFATASGFKLAVGFASQLVDDLPRDAHDLPVDAFLSERDYLRFE